MNHFTSPSSSSSTTVDATHDDTRYLASSSCSYVGDPKKLIFPRISLAGLTQVPETTTDHCIDKETIHVSQVTPSQCNQHTKCNNRYDDCQFTPTQAVSTSWSVTQNSPDTATVRCFVESRSQHMSRRLVPNSVDQLILTNIDDSGQTMTSL